MWVLEAHLCPKGFMTKLASYWKCLKNRNIWDLGPYSPVCSPGLRSALMVLHQLCCSSHSRRAHFIN